MSDLPTREDAMTIADLTLIGAQGPMAQARQIVDAYADGDVMTRAEWEATIDYQAAEQILVEDEQRYRLGWNPLPFADLARKVVDAALKIGDGNE